MALVPFVVQPLDTIDAESDFIRFGDIFDYERGVDVVDEFREFLHELFRLSPDDPSVATEELVRMASAAKYPFCLRRMLRGVVGEDMAFGAELPYLIEAESDLLAACALAGNAFWKQSLQLLRSVLEVAVAHAYFGLRGDDYFTLLQAPRFRMPPLVGRSGMLETLVLTQTVNDAFAHECRSLYALLSKRVHSHIHHLSVNESQDENSREWCELSGRVGTVLLRLVLFLLRKGI